MKSYESRTLIDARKCTVWDVITDGGNFTVWNSGITHIAGELRHGGTIESVAGPAGTVSSAYASGRYRAKR